MGDFPLTTFSSEGKLLQIEYAINAVGRGETAIGIKCREGVVLAAEKRLTSVLIDETSYHKIQNIAKHIGATYAGLGPDYRVLLQKTRKLNMEYYLKYLEDIAMSTISRETAKVVQEFTQAGGVRPFGVSVLLAGYDEEGPHLYQIDPSGAYYGRFDLCCGCFDWSRVEGDCNWENAKEPEDLLGKKIQARHRD